jgi:hypothetical protein
VYQLADFFDQVAAFDLNLFNDVLEVHTVDYGSGRGEVPLRNLGRIEAHARRSRIKAQP